jgi:hypothetical protein
MRWKLLLVAPLLAATAAAGALLLFARLTQTSHGGSPLALAFVLLPLLAAAAGAGIFVYRHTARRRLLQAAASGLLSLALSYAAFAAVEHFNG